MNKIPSDNVCKPGIREAGMQSGFTLLELILSMTILSMVSLLIGSGFHLGLRYWDLGDKEILETQRLRALSGLMSQGLKSAYPYKMEIDDEKVVLFEGEKDSVLFVTTSVEPYEGGFKWVSYTYKEDGVLLYNEGILPDKDVLDKVSKNEEILDEEIREVTFEYLSPEDEDWQESWELSDELPAAVRVNIEHYPPFLITVPMSLQNKKEEKDKSGGFG
jgi:general secretion pathway protein J